MKKLNKLFILILLISLITIGCKNNKPIGKDDVNNGPDIVIDDEGIMESEKVMRKFLELIKSENTASHLGIYIKDNIAKVDKGDADEMINWLTVYQTEIINNLNNEITSQKYLEALNETMNGILDETKIPNIKDENVKRDYQELVDGFMTIKRYEENPVVETDWKALNKLSDYVTDDLGKIFELYQKSQNYEYDREQLAVEEIAEDMIKTESILKDHKSDFIFSLANELYSLQSSTLFIGPEGNYLGLFVDKDDDEYNKIVKIKDDYPNSYLSNIVLELDSREYKSPMDVYDEIDKRLQFGIESNNYLRRKEVKEKNIQYLTFEMVIPNDEEKQNRTNKIINLNTKDFFRGKVGADRNSTVSIYSNYQDKQYISYNGFVNFNDENGYPEEINLYRTFDYINEKYVTLEEYLNTDFDILKEYLNSNLGIEIKTTPVFQLFNNGVIIYLEGIEGLDRYFELSKKDLIGYLSLDDLTKKY